VGFGEVWEVVSGYGVDCARGVRTGECLTADTGATHIARIQPLNAKHIHRKRRITDRRRIPHIHVDSELRTRRDTREPSDYVGVRRG
jgi:hypothetical protein